MRAFVDQDMCIGCGLCEGTCPEVFRMNDEGKAEAYKARRKLMPIPQMRIVTLFWKQSTAARSVQYVRRSNP